MKILTGHVSPETAYLVNDYPYGYTLRCQIRYWLEYKKGHGVRFVSQTTNPKKGGVWNKPKALTYANFGGCLFLDDEEHVQWSGLSQYTNGAEAAAWRDMYGTGCPAGEATATMNAWVAAKVAYDQRRAKADERAAADELLAASKRPDEAFAEGNS